MKKYIIILETEDMEELEIEAKTKKEARKKAVKIMKENSLYDGYFITDITREEST